MKNFKYRYEMYRHLKASIPEIYSQAKKAADEIGIPQNARGAFGLTGAISGCHGIPHKEVRDALEDSATKIVPNAKLDEELRDIIKSYYGDEYDGVATSTCEAAIWVSMDTLATPPMLGRGDNYRARYLMPYEKHAHHHGSYGRPFPGRYKDLFADRGNTPGELGFYGKRQNNLDTVFTKLVGADYTCHGIKYHPAVQLSQVDPEASVKNMRAAAERHSSMLTAVTSLGYDTPGYGYGAKDSEGTPKLQKLIGDLAEEYEVPYIVDNAWGAPFIGTDIRKVGAEVFLYSMDKASGSVTAGLIIGKEEALVPLRRAMGTHGDRFGTGTSHGKAAYVTIDPGKEGLVGVIAALKVLRDKPERFTKPLDDLHKIVTEEFGKIDSRIKNDFVITKSMNSGAIEVNYEKSWAPGGNRIPIFSIEDMYAGTNIFQEGMKQFGVIPTIAYDGNIFISPGLGTTDLDGNLIEDKARWAIQAMVKLIEITCQSVGIL